MQDVEERVRAFAGPIAESYGLDIFDVRFRRAAQGMVLRIQIDRPGATAKDSVGIADCERVSRDLSAVLDVEDVVPGAYTLEVSSPGLDRPLRHVDDYRRFMGRRAKVVMRVPVEGQGYFKGRLSGVDDHHLFIDGDDGRRHRIPLGIITRANLEVEF